MARSREAYLKAKREQAAAARAKDPAAYRKSRREAYAKDPNKRVYWTTYNHRRFFWSRANKLRGAGRARARDLSLLWYRQRGLCALTGRKLTRETAQLDHILPKARGGTDLPGNLRWVCIEVNLAKRDLTDSEFVELCMAVIVMRNRR